jgi:membrane protein YqaA with SNARE-associated domain
VGLKARFLDLAVLLAFFWGFAEGTVFFIVPDVLISLAALFSLRLAMKCSLAAVGGALLAGICVYYGSLYAHADTLAILRAVPFIPDKMRIIVQGQYNEHGIFAMFSGPLSGIPYKLYAFLAPPHADITTFLAASIPARLMRFVVVGLFWAGLAHVLRRYRKWSDGNLLFVHATGWIAFYIFYWVQVTRYAAGL